MVTGPVWWVSLRAMSVTAASGLMTVRSRRVWSLKASRNSHLGCCSFLMCGAIDGGRLGVAPNLVITEPFSRSFLEKVP